MEELILGIDFGTTNTVISIYNNKKVNIFYDGIYKLIPSKIGLYNNNIYCGNNIPTNCDKIINNFKIFFNKKFILDKEYSYDEILYIFFKYLYNLINNKYNNKSFIYNTVISCPSNFNNYQRELLNNILNSIGFNVIRIINEPTAAALAYGLHFKEETTKILVIDIGGGTSDFTILEKNDSLYEVINTDGINIGGNNFTEIIINDIIQNNKEIKNDIILFNIAENIKEKLSWLDNYKNDNINYSLSRLNFNKLSDDLLNLLNNKIINIINNNYIQDIILVGSSCKIPLIQNMIKNIDLTKNIIISNNLETIVSEGCSIYCSILKNKYIVNNDIILLDVLSLSIGVELYDGTYSIIVPKNTPLPIKINKKFTTNTNDKNIKINFYQGEFNLAKNNYLLGEYIFDNLSIGSLPIIDISIYIDLNSIINIIITDKKSGHEQNIIINNKNFINNYIDNNYIINEEDNNNLQYIHLIKNHINNNLQNLNSNNIISEEFKNNIINKFTYIDNNIDKFNTLELINIYKDLQDNYTILNTINNDNYFNIDSIENNNQDEYYKNELNNLCKYLKLSIDENKINIPNIQLLINLINETLLLLNSNDNIDWKNEINKFNDECEKIYF